MKKETFIFVAFVGGALAVAGQPFNNLGFEDADLSSLDFEGFGSTEKLLPGWTLTLGGSPVTRIRYGEDILSLIYAPRLADDKYGGAQAYNGKFALDLNDRINPPDRYELSQVGQIPPWATEMTYVFENLPFRVRIDGQDVSVTYAEDIPFSLKLKTVDVSRFAGQEVTMSFETVKGVIEEIGTHRIYDISFAVPEPSTFVLFGGGSLLLTWQGWHRRRRSG